MVAITTCCPQTPEAPIPLTHLSPKYPRFVKVKVSPVTLCPALSSQTHSGQMGNAKPMFPVAFIPLDPVNVFASSWEQNKFLWPPCSRAERSLPSGTRETPVVWEVTRCLQGGRGGTGSSSPYQEHRFCYQVSSVQGKLESAPACHCATTHGGNASRYSTCLLLHSLFDLFSLCFVIWGGLQAVSPSCWSCIYSLGFWGVN